MSCKSFARDSYFTKHCEWAATPEQYIKALKASPFKKHRNMAVVLGKQLEQMVLDRDRQLAEIERTTVRKEKLESKGTK